jgi:hypothetical protein
VQNVQILKISFPSCILKFRIIPNKNGILGIRTENCYTVLVSYLILFLDDSIRWKNTVYGPRRYEIFQYRFHPY